MTANLSNQPQDYSMFMQEIAQLRKEISEAKQQQQHSPQQQGAGASSMQQFGTTQQQPQLQQQGAGAGKKQGKAQTMAEMKNTIERFNESLRSLQDQVQSLRSGHGEEYDERFADFEHYEGGGNGGQQYRAQQQPYQQQQQGQYEKGFQQQGQGGQQQFDKSQQHFGQGQQGGQQGFQQGQGRVQPGPDQYQTRATGPGKAPTNPAMPGTGQGRPNRPRPLPLDKRRALLQNKPKTLRETFQAELVEEIAFVNWKRKRLVLIGEDRLLERALSRINSHNIQCLPVVSAQGKGIIGTIDILDIIQELINSFDSNADKNVQQTMRRDFMNRRVSTLLSKRSYVISSAASLYTAVGYMIQLEQDRFVVVDRKVENDVTALTQPEMDVDGLFTLHDVVRFLVQNSILMREEPEFHRSLHELGLGQNPPKIISHTTMAAEAFKQIGHNCCMGLAVVDDNGCLIGNLSATDLKGVTRNNCPILNSPVQDFITRDQKRGWWERPFSIDLNDSLYHTIHQFVSLGIHRMYVVDQQHKPIGEVSLRDIMNIVWKVIK